MGPLWGLGLCHPSDQWWIEHLFSYVKSVCLLWTSVYFNSFPTFPSAVFFFGVWRGSSYILDVKTLYTPPFYSSSVKQLSHAGRPKARWRPSYSDTCLPGAGGREEGGLRWTPPAFSKGFNLYVMGMSPARLSLAVFHHMRMSSFNGAVINASLPSPRKMGEQSLNIHAPKEGIYGKVQWILFIHRSSALKHCSKPWMDE